MLTNISRHAIDRFRQRVLPDNERATDFEIAQMIRQAGSGPLTAIRTQLDGAHPETRIWKYFYQWKHRGRPYYVAVDRSGTAALTVLTAQQLCTWDVDAMARRIPGVSARANHPTPVATEGRWRIVDDCRF